MDTLFNVNQVAFILKVHPLTVRRYIREEKLSAVKVGGNVRIQEKDLQSFTKSFTTRHKHAVPPMEKHMTPIRQFTADDPWLRMEGRGSSVVQR